jgi:hypothetical protein
MNETALIAAAVLALGYALASKRLENSILTGPLIFLCLGGVLSQTGILHIEQAEESLHLLAEITLIIVLFAWPKLRVSRFLKHTQLRVTSCMSGVAHRHRKKHARSGAPSSPFHLRVLSLFRSRHRQKHR